MFVCLALMLISPPQSPVTGAAAELLLQVHGAEGFEPLVELRSGERRTLAAPLTTLSERVPRAVPGPRGHGLRLSGAGPGQSGTLSILQMHAVHHERGAHVVFDGEDILIVTPEQLPSSVVAGHLPSLARRDAHGPPASLAELELRLPLSASLAGRALLLVAREDVQPTQLSLLGTDASPVSLELQPGPQSARLLSLAPGRLVITGRVGALDQLLIAHARDLSPEAGERLALLDHGQVRLTGWRDHRRAGQGRSWRLPKARGVGWGEGEGRDAQSSEPLELGWGEDQALDLWFATPEPAPEGQTTTLLFILEARAGAEPQPAGVASAAAAPRTTALLDVTEALGLSFSHLEGPAEQLDIRPTMGPGAAWGDVDGDGWCDLYLVQGAGRSDIEPLANRLYHNHEGQRFEDRTGAAGCEDPGGAGMAALFLDVEGDADLDLYVANYGLDALFENHGSGRFADVRSSAGLTSEGWSAGICAADHDLDGDLDLYVTSYLDYDEEALPNLDGLQRFRREDPVAMLPFAFPGAANVFLRNESQAGAISFADVTVELGLRDEAGRGMQAIAWDFDRDGRPDLYVANDVSYNMLWRNAGMEYEDVSFSTGMDDPRGGMGLAVGDVDGDGDEDLFLTNWQLEANALYLNNLFSHRSQRHRVASFRDGIVQSGLGGFGVGSTSWGAVHFDLENDGDLDHFVANGYTSPDYESTGICVGQRDHLFLNNGSGRFEEGSGRAPEALSPALPSRAAVGCDWDLDGDMDLVVTANNARARLLRNEATSGAFLGVRLRQPGRNPLAIGAEVTLTAGGRTFRRQLLAGTSYLGGNPPELLFGIGPVDRVERLDVRWPSGAETRLSDLLPNRWITISP